jgi:hypothetical protein
MRQRRLNDRAADLDSERGWLGADAGRAERIAERIADRGPDAEWATATASADELAHVSDCHLDASAIGREPRVRGDRAGRQVDLRAHDWGRREMLGLQLHWRTR